MPTESLPRPAASHAKDATANAARNIRELGWCGLPNQLARAVANTAIASIRPASRSTDVRRFSRIPANRTRLTRRKKVHRVPRAGAFLKQPQEITVEYQQR